MNKNILRTARLACTAAVSMVLLAGGATAQGRPQNPLGPSSGQASKFKPAPESEGFKNRYLVLLDAGQVRFGKDPRAAARPFVADFAHAQAAAFGGKVIKAWDAAAPAYLIELDAAQAEKLSRLASVRVVEQDRRVVPLSAPACNTATEFDDFPASSTSTPQPLNCAELDPRSGSYECSDNWGLARIDSVEIPEPENYSYNYTTPGSPADVHIYVIDTGLSVSSDVISGGRIGSFYNAAYLGAPLAGDMDDCVSHGHGTHVTAIAAGEIFGVAREAIVEVVKFWDKCSYSSALIPPTCPHGGGTGDYTSVGNCGGGTSSLLDAIDYIADSHDTNYPGEPAVVNASLNLAVEHETISQAVKTLVETEGIVFVQSAGNNFDFGSGITDCSRTFGTTTYPVPAAIIAGGTDIEEISSTPTDVRWIREGEDTSENTPDPDSYEAFCLVTEANCNTGNIGSCDCGSQRGSCIDIWAPAAHIVSAWRNSIEPTFVDRDRCRLSGTSMAAPHVAGVAARILQRYPDATPAEVQQALADYAAKDMIYDSLSTLHHYSIGTSANHLLQTHLAPLAVTWVDFAFNGNIEHGTENLPWDSLTEGKNNVVGGTILRFKAGSTSAGATFTTAVTLQAAGGSAFLGQP